MHFESIYIIHDGRHVGFAIIMQISYTLLRWQTTRETKQLCLVFNLLLMKLIMKFKQWDQLKVFFSDARGETGVKFREQKRSEIRRQKWHRWRAAIETRSHRCIGFISGPIRVSTDTLKNANDASSSYRCNIPFPSQIHQSSTCLSFIAIDQLCWGLNRPLPIGLQM